MSWRIVVITTSAKLDYQLGYMVIRNEKITKISLSEISTVIIETTAVSITAALLCELTKKKVKVVFCDEKRNPSSELVPYYNEAAYSDIQLLLIESSVREKLDFEDIYIIDSDMCFIQS